MHYDPGLFFISATAIYHRLTQQIQERIERFAEMATTREKFERRMLELREEIAACQSEAISESPRKVEVKLSMSQVLTI